MKKLCLLLACGLTIAALAACNKTPEGPNTPTTVPDGTGNDTNATIPDAGSTGNDTAGADVLSPGSASLSSNPEAEKETLSILTAVWDTYEGDDLFPVAGGDFSEQNAVMDAPGVFGIGDAANIDNYLGLPQTSYGKIDSIASVMHMMNANTFTCGVYHVSDSGDVKAVADDLKANIMKREWMCGFPDKLLVIQMGDYIFCAFGNAELIDTFHNKVMEVYDSATVLYDESIA